MASVETDEGLSQEQNRVPQTRDMAQRSNGECPSQQAGRPGGIHNTGEVGSSVHSNTPSFTSKNYQKLTNPLSYLLKELPVVDGNDAHLLCDFLLKVITICKVGQITKPTIYELLYPYCRGELLAFLNQALTGREHFARLLRQFIPVRQLSQLRIENYERVQRDGESLAMYIHAIRDAAVVLRINQSEVEVLARIVEGLTPIQRARFVFQTPPSTFFAVGAVGRC
jgi:hypothetical protein